MQYLFYIYMQIIKTYKYRSIILYLLMQPDIKNLISFNIYMPITAYKFQGRFYLIFLHLHADNKNHTNSRRSFYLC